MLCCSKEVLTSGVLGVSVLTVEVLECFLVFCLIPLACFLSYFLSCTVKIVVLGCRPWLLVRVVCVVVRLARVSMLGAQPTAAISGKQLDASSELHAAYHCRLQCPARLMCKCILDSVFWHLEWCVFYTASSSSQRPRHAPVLGVCFKTVGKIGRCYLSQSVLML